MQALTHYRASLALGAAAAALIWWRCRQRATGEKADSFPEPPDEGGPNRRSAPVRGPIAAAIHSKVTHALQPSKLVVHDDSAAHRGHRGVAGSQSPETHFKVEVVSAAFQGVSKLERQRQVQGLLKEEFAAGLHALELSCRTPAEQSRAESK
mmetsp:Transcript_32265/g.60762  ORF Transcript_32265/g.60762 Transcript_32265/m.60762 type:complete len:152 (+) Transcript_32265:45-500(+)